MFLSFVNYIRLNVNEAFTPKKLLDFFSFNKSRNVKLNVFITIIFKENVMVPNVLQLLNYNMRILC